MKRKRYQMLGLKANDKKKTRYVRGKRQKTRKIHEMLGGKANDN